MQGVSGKAEIVLSMELKEASCEAEIELSAELKKLHAKIHEEPSWSFMRSQKMSPQRR